MKYAYLSAFSAVISIVFLKVFRGDIDSFLDFASFGALFFLTFCIGALILRRIEKSSRS